MPELGEMAVALNELSTLDAMRAADTRPRSQFSCAPPGLCRLASSPGGAHVIHVCHYSEAESMSSNELSNPETCLS